MPYASYSPEKSNKLAILISLTFSLRHHDSSNQGASIFTNSNMKNDPESLIPEFLGQAVNQTMASMPSEPHATENSKQLLLVLPHLGFHPAESELSHSRPNVASIPQPQQTQPAF